MTPETLTEEKIRPAQLVRRLKVLSPELTPHEILDKGLRGKRWETIPTAEVLMDIVINDEEHVGILSDSIFGEEVESGLGQLSPINAAAFLNEDGGRYFLITDGYHRTDAFIRKREDHIEAIVLYGLRLEEVYDLRVLVANSTKSVGFARVVEFMQRSFEQTDWYQAKGLTLLQAFSLCVQGTSGVRLQLEPYEAIKLKKWAMEKARQWSRKPGSIFQALLIASKADPELVRKVRVGTGGGHGEGSGVWNPARLKAVTDEIPHRYDLQKAVYEAVVQHDLVADETQKLAKVVAHFADKDEPDIVELACSNAKTVAEVAGIIPDNEGIKDALLVGLYHDLDPKETIRLAEVVSSVGDNDELKDLIYQDPRKFIGKAKLASVSSDDNGHGSPLDKVLFDAGPDDKTAGYSIAHSIQDLEQHIVDLEEALVMAQKEGGAESWKKRTRTWWKAIPGLSIEERRVFEMVFSKRRVLRVKDIAQSLGLTENQIVKLIMSGVNRYYVHQKEQLEDHVFRMMYDHKDGSS